MLQSQKRQKDKLLKKKKGGVPKRHLRFRAGLFLIIINLSVFYHIVYSGVPKEALASWVLSPANLRNGNFLCLITSGFLHGNWMHLLFNMGGVFIFASIVETHFGFVKTVCIYLSALFISMLFAIAVYILIMHKNTAIIGASGALMGLIACAMLLDPLRITYEMIIPLPVMLKAWFFFYADLKGFLGGEQDGVSHLTHLFGFFSIAILVYFFNKVERKKMQKGLIINVVTFAILIILNQWIFYKTGKNFVNMLQSGLKI